MCCDAFQATPQGTHKLKLPVRVVHVKLKWPIFNSVLEVGYSKKGMTLSGAAHHDGKIPQRLLADMIAHSSAGTNFSYVILEGK